MPNGITELFRTRPQGAASVSRVTGGANLVLDARNREETGKLFAASWISVALPCATYNVSLFYLFIYILQKREAGVFRGEAQIWRWMEGQRKGRETWAHWRNATEKEDSFLRRRVRQPDPGAKKGEKKKEVPVLPSLDTVSTLNSLYSRFQRQALAFVRLIGGPL